MNGTLWGLAVQGGVGIVSLLVLYLSLRDLSKRVADSLDAMRGDLHRLTGMVGQVLGRTDATPAVAPRPPRGRHEQRGP